MSHPVVAECVKSAKSAVASFEERKEIEAEKFKAEPTHYMSWGSPLIAMEYVARIANHILYCPCSFPLSRALLEKRKQELSSQLSYSGGGSSSAFHNATDSFIASARCNMLERGWLSEHYIAQIAKAEASVGWRIMATKKDGEVYFAYDGSVYHDRARVENECAGCNKAWPDIKFEVVPAEEVADA